MTVFNVFVSSTSADLTAHREEVMAAIRRLKQREIGMEFFGATANAPVTECVNRVAEADVVVLIVAHRYGWVPSHAEGGDDARSITQIEYDAAIAANKDVLVFLVEPKALWAHGKEQDRLLEAEGEADAAAVYRAVARLKEFRRTLESKQVRDSFVTPHELASKVSTSLFGWLEDARRKREKVTAEASTDMRSEMDAVLAQAEEERARGNHALAYRYLSAAQEKLSGPFAQTVANARLDVALQLCGVASPTDKRLAEAAQALIALAPPSKQQLAKALKTLGKYQGMSARKLYAKRPEEAIQLAEQARQNLVRATEIDPIDPDHWGTLGGHLKRLAEWEQDPGRKRQLEDAMLRAYEDGWTGSPDCYPLLNYIEQRALLRSQRGEVGASGQHLIAPEEHELRSALEAALKDRQAHVKRSSDKPWAAFDIARGRHYLSPNVVQFLEDLKVAIEDAREVANGPDDAWMMSTTAKSLQTLLDAGVQLDGLRDGIELLEQATLVEYWFDQSRVQGVAVPPYLMRELTDLRSLLESSVRAGRDMSAQAWDIQKRLSGFIAATEIRWSKEDEAEFQRFVKDWKHQLQPTEAKIARGLWKVLGAKTLETFTGPIPVDWNAAVDLITGSKEG